MSKSNFPRSNDVLSCGHCLEYERIDRRAFLMRGMQSAAGLLIGNALTTLPTWMPRITLAPPHQGPRGDTLVCIFLRGGADGLNMVVPFGEDAYYKARPILAIPRPDDTSAEFNVVDLDGFFGLHPALAPLSTIYRSGALAFIQATGSPDETRSHFEAMALMERGATTGRDYAGWLARHLATLDTGNLSALRAISIGEMLPASLTGTLAATAFQSIDAYHLIGQEGKVHERQRILSMLYSQQDNLLTAAARQIFDSIEILEQINTASYTPSGREYPESEFGMAMRTIAQLIDADIGVEVACVDLGGWDTHAGQGAGDGAMARLMRQLAQGLTAFYEDLGHLMDNVTVVVMSEFGRRVQENAAIGTDHGHGNMMMVMGNGIQGGQVFSKWPGLEKDQRVGPGDLKITIDFRDVLGEILSKRLNNPQLSEIFPGHTLNEIGLAISRTPNG